MKNYYEALRIGQQATQEEITESYRLLAQMYHPDRFAGNERKCREANEMMRELNEAYQVLRDPVRRQAYDQTLRPAVQRHPATHQPARRPAQYAPNMSAARRSVAPPFTSEEYCRARNTPQRSRLRVPVAAPAPQRVPIRTPMDLVALLLRPFHYLGLTILLGGQLVAWSGLFILVVSLVTSFVALWLEFHRLLPPELGRWAVQGVDFGILLIMSALAAGLLPLAWIGQLFMTVNPVLYYLIGAAVIFATIKILIALVRHVFGLPKRAPQSSYTYCSERLTLFSIFGALWVSAVVHGFLITDLLH